MPFESYTLPQGKIMIAFSDKNMSIGTLHINPKQELTKHSRPALESLFQIKGTCIVNLFEEGGPAKSVVLKEGESIDIPPKKAHIHSNPHSVESITFWKASGDITKIIDDIRKKSEM